MSSGLAGRLRQAVLPCLLAAAGLAAVSGQGEAARFLFWALLGLNAYAAAVLFTARRLTVRRCIRPLRLAAGGRVEVVLELELASRLPVLAEVRDGLPPELAGRAAPPRMLGLPVSRPGRIWHYKVTDLPRGLYIWEDVRVVLRDLFGLVSREISFPARDRVVVFPELVPVEGFLGGRSLPSFPSRARTPLGEAPETAGVRDYYTGDRLSQIHWPATAHTGELKTRELLFHAAAETVILLDAGAADFPAALEAACRLAASLSVYALDGGRPVRLHALGRAERTAQAASRRSLAGVLELLAAVRPEPEGRFAQDAGFLLQHLRPGSLAVLIAYRPRTDLLEAMAAALRRRVELLFLLVGSLPMTPAEEGLLAGMERLGVRVRRLGEARRRIEI